MSLGWSVDYANSLLAATFQGVGVSVDEVWVQLHTDEPGADGTANLCALTDRADATTAFSTDPAAGAITNDADIGATEWVDPPATETPTHASLWDAATLGTYLGSGLVASAAITAHSPFQLDAGDVTASLPTAA